AALLNWMQTELADQFNRINQMMGISPEQFVQIYRTTGEVRVIRKDYETAGFAWIEKRGNALHIHALFILPAFRRQGIGTAFFQELDNEFSGKVEFLELGVEEINHNAIALYQKQGFNTFRKIPDLGYWVMRKFLVSVQTTRNKE
ncbi:MAG: GNAT family N-acetyltransferase, partial [Anaerolineae bacterium]|nr:GNAT family N-acetyltransferase [Anaerolineae bacterium]